MRRVIALFATSFLLSLAVSLASFSLFSASERPLGEKVSISAGRSTFTAQEQYRSLIAAARFWSEADPVNEQLLESVCPVSDIQIIWRSFKEMDDGEQAGRAVLGACRDEPVIEMQNALRQPTFANNYTDLELCLVIVHEVGHLLGYNHVGNPFMIMHSGEYTEHADERIPPESAQRLLALKSCSRAGV